MEHPEITMTLRTGYPKPYKENTVVCAYCGREISARESAYDWDGDVICEKCCRECIDDNYSLRDIAEALKIPMSGVK